jgi:hypothetical protein
MGKMSKEEQIQKFDEFVPKVAKVHPQTWCFKKVQLVLTVTLKGEECVNCQHFVLNGGICDPL